MTTKRQTIVLASGLAALTALALVAWALRTGAGEPLPPPPGIKAPTPTPDRRGAVPPDEAAARLSRNPNIGAVVSAVQRGDVDSLLALVDWQPQRCGLRGTDLCPDGVQPYTELPMIDAGFPVPFWVTAETLRPTLNLLLRGEPLTLRVALQSRRDPRQYQVAFAGPPKGPGVHPLAAPTASLTGLYLVLDASRDRPITWVYPLSEQWPATSQAFAFGLENQEIIAWDEDY